MTAFQRYQSAAVIALVAWGVIVALGELGTIAPDHWDRLDTFLFGALTGALAHSFLGAKT